MSFLKLVYNVSGKSNNAYNGLTQVDVSYGFTLINYIIQLSYNANDMFNMDDRSPRFHLSEHVVN